MEQARSYHREHYRLAVGYPVMFSNHNAVGEGKVISLSVFGCTIDTPTPLPEGHTLALRLILPDRNESLPIEEAEVRWVRGNQIGVRFVKIERAANVRLHGFVWDRMLERFETILSSSSVS